MAYQEHDVALPPELFIRATETREPQHWTDDRGFTYEVAFSAEADKPLALCVDRPEGANEMDAWYRDDPAPEVRL
jgi:hypothetical protein